MMEIYERKFQPRVLDIMETEQVKPTSIINYLQESAYEHAYHLGISFQHTFKQHLTWFLLRYYIEIKRYPVLDEHLILRTWISNSGPKYSLRDFQIVDEAGESLVNASTSWILYNFIRRKQVDHNANFSNIPILEQRSVDYDYPKIPLPEKVDLKAQFKVRYSDLDLNNHVNNRVYLEWALESIPRKQLKEYQVNKLEISFKRQAFYNEDILVETELRKVKNDEHDIIAYHKISNMKSGVLLTKLVSYWKKRTAKPKKYWSLG